MSTARILVTGGLGVLGRAVVARLLADGASVAILDRTGSKGGAPPPDAVTYVGAVDLGDAAAAKAEVDRAASHLGGLSGLVNIAGGFVWEKIESGSVESWERMFVTNLRTAVVVSQAALPHLLTTAGTAAGTAAIVNVGANAAHRAAAGMGAYAASKAGVARLTEAMSEELKLRNVRVNAVLPSIIDTPANRAGMPNADFSRWVAPAELADVVGFLLSERASAVTGACIPVTGRV